MNEPITLNESVADALVLLDKEARVISWNKEAEQIRGYHATEIIGKNIQILFSKQPYKAPSLQQLIEKATLQGNAVYEGWNERKDGATFWGKVSITALFDDTRALNGFIIATKDLSRQMETEHNEDLSITKYKMDELNQSEYKYRSLFVHNPVPMLVMELGTFKFLDVNEAAVFNYGYTREEFLSMTALDIRPSQDQTLFHDFARPPITTAEEEDRGIWKHVKKDGTVITVAVKAHDIVFEGRKARLIFPNDITEKVLAENQLKASELRYRSIIEQGWDGIFIFDGTDDFIDVNPSACDMLGYTKQEILLLTRYDIMFNGPDKDTPNKLKALRAGKQVLSENVMRHKDGTAIPVEISSRMLPDGKYMGIVRNITERKKAEEKIRKANRLYAFNSQINQAIVKVHDEQMLIEDACRIALSTGKLTMAMIGMLHTEEKEFVLRAEAGADKEDVQIFSNVNYRTDSVTARVLQTGHYFVSNEVSTDVDLERWRTYAATRGIRSFMILPLKKSGIVIGTFNLFAAESNFFDQEEITLLKEVAVDLSFALDNIEREQQRKITEEKLAHNEARLNEAQAVAHIGSWELDFATGIAMWSDESCRIYGLDPSESKQSFDTWISFIHPDDRDRVIKQIKQAQATFSDSSSYHRIVRKDGVVRHVFSQNQFDFNSEGVPLGLHGVDHDITDRKIAEEALQHSEANLRLIMDLVPYSIFAKNERGDYLFVNKSMAKLYGWSMEEMIGKNELDLIPVNEQAMKYMAEDREVILTGNNKIIPETKFTDHAGNDHYFYSIKVPFTPAGSNEQGVLGVAINITEIKAVERSLKESKYLWEKAQEVAHVGHWVSQMKKEGALIWSDETYRIYGINKGDIVLSNEAILSMIHPDDRVAMQEKAMKSILHKVPYNLEHRIMRPDGTIRWVHELGEVFYDDHDLPVQMIGIVRDITDDKARETEKARIINDLVQHNKDLEQFAYIVSHNLRAPLANIIGIAEMMSMQHTDNPQENKLMDKLFTSVNRLDTVIKDLNNVLQVKFQVNEKKELIHLSSLLKDITLSIQNLMVSEEVEIHSDFTAIDELVSLKSYIYSIFFNLISNSIKYRQHDLHPVIEIYSVKKPDKIEIYFKDNGLGIDLEKKGDQVFGLYKRFHPHAEGKGMGLYMIKTQVETLGGRIKIDSKVNVGTQFTIEIPIK